MNDPPQMKPTSVANGRQSPFKFPSQSAASSQTNRSPSDGSITQDSAFPPFPTSRSRSTTPTTPSDIQQSFAFYNLNDQSQPDSESSFAPLSPRSNGAGSVSQRMNLIAPGPFNLSKNGNTQPSGHKRTATMGSGKDFTYQPSSGKEKGHSPRPSTVEPSNPGKPSLSNISNGPRSTVNRSKSDLPNMPTESLGPRRSYIAEIINEEPIKKEDRGENSIEALRQENRSHTYPVGGPNQKGSQELKPDAFRRPSAAAAIRPLHEIGSVSSFKPSRSLKEQAKPKVKLAANESLAKTNNEIRETYEKTLEKAFNLPTSKYSQSYTSEIRHHTPNESVSSTESMESDGKIRSSTSTPHTSGSSPRPKRRPSNLHHGGGLMQEFQFGLEDSKPTLNEATPQQDNPTSNFGGSMDPPQAYLSIPIEPGTLAPGSLHDPAIHSGRASPATTPDDSFNPSFPLGSDNLRLSPAPQPPSIARTSPLQKPAKINKGQCRGCKELIVGKSVSSADGRLTGRYHKRCFVCLTCKAPFRTADFYVFENHPYCEQHYHQLNNSVCGDCNKGIEGQYLETELKMKFHPDCFKCQVGELGL